MHSIDLFRFEFCDSSKSIQFLEKPIVTCIAMHFTSNELFWQLTLRAYNLRLYCLISKLKYSVALEEFFQMMCLNLQSMLGQNVPIKKAWTNGTSGQNWQN